MAGLIDSTAVQQCHSRTDFWHMFFAQFAESEFWAWINRMPSMSNFAMSQHVMAGKQLKSTREDYTWRAVASKFAVGMPNSFEPRPKPRTTLPFNLHTGCKGITPPTRSSKGGSPYFWGSKSRRLVNVSDFPAASIRSPCLEASTIYTLLTPNVYSIGCCDIIAGRLGSNARLLWRIQDIYCSNSHSTDDGLYLLGQLRILIEKSPGPALG